MKKKFPELKKLELIQFLKLKFNFFDKKIEPITRTEKSWQNVCHSSDSDNSTTQIYFVPMLDIWLSIKTLCYGLIYGQHDLNDSVD